MNKEIAPSSEEDIRESIENSRKSLNYPLSLAEKILEEAKKGEIDGSEVRRALKI